METKDVLRKVDSLNIDSRFSLIVGSYFCAKVKLGEITEETIDTEINRFQQKIKHFEFIKSSKFKAAYEPIIGAITLNADFLNQDNLEEMLLLTFIKIEEALNLPQQEEKTYVWRQGDALLHIKSFQESMALLKELRLPYNDNYDALYNIINVTLNREGNALDEEIKKDRATEITCYDIDELFNKVISRGEWNSNIISEIINLYRYRIIIDKENGIDVTSEKYQNDLQKAIENMQRLYKNNYANENQCQQNIEQLVEMINLPKEKEVARQKNETNINRNNELYETIVSRFTKEPDELTTEYIQDRVNKLLERKPNYDRRLACLLPHFFVRSANIYGWNKDDFEQRINSMDSIIEKVGFIPMNIYIGGDTAINEIRINSTKYLDSKGRVKNDKSSLLSLMRSFFHEAGHNTDVSSREGMLLQERLSSAMVDNIFYEWTNTVFERTIMGQLYEDESAMTLNQHGGYESMANAGSMISAALGMNEIELARLKDAGLEQTIKYFDEHFSYYPGLYEKIKTTFSIPDLKSEGRKAKIMHQQMYKEVYSLCLDVLDARIENEMQAGHIEDLEEYQELQKYFLRKINLNYQIASKKYGLRKDARKIVKKTEYTTDKISDKDIKRIGGKICSESEFGFQNEDIIEELKYRERKPTLRESLKMRFGKQTLLLESGYRKEDLTKSYSKNNEEVDRE